MDNGRTTTAVVAALAALGGLVLGAAVMLAALEARAAAEETTEQRVEALFMRLAGSGRIDILLDELPAVIPAFAIGDGARDLAGFVTEQEESGEDLTYALYATDDDPQTLIAGVQERARAEGWELRDRGTAPGQIALCPPDGIDTAITVITNEVAGATNVVVLRQRGRFAESLCAPTGLTAEAFGPTVYQRMQSGQPPAGVSSSGTSASAALGRWSASRTFTVDLPLEDVVDHYQVVLGRGRDVEFEAFEDGGRAASVTRFAADDEVFGTVSGFLLVTVVELDSGAAYYVQMSVLSTSSVP